MPGDWGMLQCGEQRVCVRQLEVWVTPWSLGTRARKLPAPGFKWALDQQIRPCAFLFSLQQQTQVGCGFGTVRLA